MFSLIQQAVTLVSGLIIPRMMIGAFGSEANGAVSSITTFLAYITLLEGGLGAVTRSALYKAFASHSEDRVSAVFYETRRLYRMIAVVFVVYVIVIAFLFKTISHNDTFNFWYSFLLVIVIAFSTFAEYFIGISYSLLLQGDQSTYILCIFRIITTILNTALCIVLITIRSDILTVKLLTGLVLVLRPVMLAIYARKKYRLRKVETAEKQLVQKSSAIGQHIAWTLHNNTDVTVITAFKGLTLVSVYSVYNMIAGQLQNLMGSLTAGMEAVLGSMYANSEQDNLQKTFGYYETLIGMFSTVVFSAAAVMISPFVRIYTSGIRDVSYDYPIFGVTLLAASMLYCMRSPYRHMVIAAGHFKQTRMAAFGEAIVNIASSCLLVVPFGLTGVAVGTVLATMFSFIYYVYYLSRNVLCRPIREWVKRMAVNIGSCVLVFAVGSILTGKMKLDSYLSWAGAAIIVLAVASAIVIGTNLALYRNDVKSILRKTFGRA